MRAISGRFGFFASLFLSVVLVASPGPLTRCSLSQAAEIVSRARRSIDDERREPPLGRPVRDEGSEDSRAGEHSQSAPRRGGHAEGVPQHSVAHARGSAAASSRDAPQYRNDRVRRKQHARPLNSPGTGVVELVDHGRPPQCGLGASTSPRAPFALRTHCGRRRFQPISLGASSIPTRGPRRPTQNFRFSGPEPGHWASRWRQG
jgi:hypothetical protein